MVNSLWDYKMCPPLVFAGQFTVFGFDMINISWKWQPNATDLASIRNVPQFRHQQNFSHLFFVRVISFWIISYVFFFLSFLFWSTNIFFFTAASHFHRFALCFIAFESLLRLIAVKKMYCCNLFADWSLYLSNSKYHKTKYQTHYLLLSYVLLPHFLKAPQ